ncbi:hypothetical protein ACQKTA_00695 [Enterococcus sp. 22-H-5-01]|uniref:hypothetical protein n=1 Tax=Enterococcus sp. 22-H-5-01 TaxID=3418555 RepID=UPI003CFEDFF0
MDKKQYLNFYWQYYLHLEHDFSNTTEFVTLDIANFKTFSIEYQKLLLAIGSECEILFKELCDFESNSPKKMHHYKSKIKSEKLMELDNRVRVINFAKTIMLQPLGEKWPEVTPYWWRRYNEVKHGRSINYKQANLENVLNALASLYLLEEYVHRKIIKKNEIDLIVPESNLFSLLWTKRTEPTNKMTLEYIRNDN